MTFSQSSSVTPTPLNFAWPPAHIWETMGAADRAKNRKLPPKVKPLIDIFPGVSATFFTHVFERKLKVTKLIHFKEKSVTDCFLIYLAVIGHLFGEKYLKAIPNLLIFIRQILDLAQIY
ncbi:unnamed protein product [Penicillium salamii]|nr:unnamed protein product [Penicillium salamii]